MRIKNLFRNSFFSMLSQFALLILGFFSQRAMNLYMGAELVGMNGVISNVINILSVTELGISTAIVYHLYGALARKDEAEIASLMNLYRKAYHVFAVLVFAAGMAVLPFIHLFMKNNSLTRAAAHNTTADHVHSRIHSINSFQLFLLVNLIIYASHSFE